MPRGYLKHSKATGRKQSRGGSSHSSRYPSKKSGYPFKHRRSELRFGRQRHFKDNDDDRYNQATNEYYYCPIEAAELEAMQSRGFLQNYDDEDPPSHFSYSLCDEEGSEFSLVRGTVCSGVDSLSGSDRAAAACGDCVCVVGDEESEFSLIDDDEGDNDAASYSIVTNVEQDQDTETFLEQEHGDERSLEIVEQALPTACAAPGTQLPTKAITATTESCAVCQEEKATFRLMKKCSCHPSACFDCLRKLYITKPQTSEEDVVSLYPLSCFWPSCGRPIRNTQIQRLVTCPEELYNYYRDEREARAERLIRQGKEPAWVKEKHPKTWKWAIRLKARKELIRSVFFHSTEQEAESVLAAMSTNPLDGMALCPRCFVVVVKDGGCDQMNCGVCGRAFSFRKQWICFDVDNLRWPAVSRGMICL